MMTIARFLTMLCAVGVAQTALAQPKAVRRRGPPSVVPAAPAPPPARPDTRKLCASRQAILDREQRLLERYQADAAGVAAEIAELRRRLADLEREQAQNERQVSFQTSKVQRLEQAHERECADGQCEQAQAQIASLDARGSDIEKRIAEIRRQYGASRTSIQGLEKRVEPLRQEYTQKRCNDLVPGETSQATIDRCAAIFSEWNQLQGQINAQNRTLADLKRQYEQHYAELDSVGKRAEGIQATVASKCKDHRGPSRQTRRDYGQVRQNARALGAELDQLIDTVTRLRGIRINVTAQ